MKKTILLSIIGLIAITASAQKIKETEVPAAVKATLTKEYPNVKVKSWEKEKGNFEAEFDFKKTEMSVLIDPTGKLIETETEIKVSELPKNISEYCSTNYKNKKIKEASKIIDSQGIVTYEAEITKMDVLFDASGKFIKEVKD